MDGVVNATGMLATGAHAGKAVDGELRRRTVAGEHGRGSMQSVVAAVEGGAGKANMCYRETEGERVRRRENRSGREGPRSPCFKQGIR